MWLKKPPATQGNRLRPPEKRSSCVHTFAVVASSSGAFERVDVLRQADAAAGDAGGQRGRVADHEDVAVGVGA